MQFTKEQLIARIERQIDINATIIERLGDDSAAASELAVETATMDIKILDVALASLEADSDSNSHPASGPLSNDRLHRIREILSKAAAQSDGGNIGYAMSDAVKTIDELLEVRKAEPVGYYRKGSDGFYFASPTEQRPGTIPLYRHAQPAPGVPVGVINGAREPVLYGEHIGIAIGTHLYAEPQPAPVVPDFETVLESLDYEVRCNARESEHVMQACRAMYDACRAAMLNGGKS